MQFKIFDWAGNAPFGEKLFKTFDEAWEFLFSRFEDEDLQEFVVCEV